MTCDELLATVRPELDRTVWEERLAERDAGAVELMMLIENAIHGLVASHLDVLARKLPDPHVWAWARGDRFYCQNCLIGFEFGTGPMPERPCPSVAVAAAHAA